MAMQNSNPNQYDFIMNPGGSQKKKGLIPEGVDKKKVFIAAGSVFFVFAILISLLFSGGTPNSDLLLRVAQRQNELIRVSEIGVKNARGTEALELAKTVQLNLRSDQTPLLAALKAQKVKVGPKQLGVMTNPKTDIILNEARQNNRFDEVFVAYIQSELLTYQKDLNEAYRTSTNKALKETLKTQYDNATILIGTEVN